MDSSAVPRHVAIIMDGNGRWAEARGEPRTAGHRAGADSVREAVRACGELGVEVLTLYSFSTENWGRPEDEVEALMGLLEHYLRSEVPELMERRVRLRSIGETWRLPAVVHTLLQAGQAITADNDGLQLVIALSYGSRTELTEAVKAIAAQVRDGELDLDDIDESTIAAHLYAGDLPDPDLLIRTSGEMRLSNFLLWQVAYAELYVTDVLWPDFRRAHLVEAFEAFSGRRRRYGMTDAQRERSG